MTKDKEKVLLVTVLLDKDKEKQAYKMLELQELVRSAGAEIFGEILQIRHRIDPTTYIGKGKVEEIKEAVENNELDGVVFNNELTGSQMRNLEEAIGCKIVDRTGLILDIFATRAKSNEGKVQVKLAQLQYRLPRLVGMRKYLSREGAGIGTRGPGEQKLETDRRTILREIDQAKRQLEELSATRETTRKQRTKSSLPVVALVGYTNVGKSTIMNGILEQSGTTDKYVYADDRLFATLDPALRGFQLPGGYKAILSDTVGFVSDIPTSLIDAFRSTLEEVKYADLIVHVLDATSTDIQEQAAVTNNVFTELDVVDIPILTVFNKVDLCTEPTFHTQATENSIEISALKSQDINRLLERIEELLYGEDLEVEVHLPYAALDKMTWMIEALHLKLSHYDDSGAVLIGRVASSWLPQIKPYIVEGNS